MSLSYKLQPGPAGRSCLTCKRRHKKCDNRQPLCERCERGGFECLGYDHNKRGAARSSLGLPNPRSTLHVTDEQSASNPAHPQTSESDDHIKASPLELGHELEPTKHMEWQLPGRHQCASQLSTSSLGSPSVSLEGSQSAGIGSPLVAGACHEPRALTGRELDYPTPCTTSTYRSAKYASRPAHQMMPESSQIYIRVPYSPYHLSKTLLDSSILEDYVMMHWDRKIGSTLFSSVMSTHIQNMRSSTISKLRESSIGRWVTFVMAKVCESSADGDASQNHIYELWINQIDQVFRDASPRHSNASEVQRCLTYWLQALIMKTMVVPSSFVYQVLRQATSVFLQMVYSNPTLWSNHYDPTSIPLANVMASPRLELIFFVLVDATTAMAFGIPQRVEYAFDSHSPPPAASSFDYAHCHPKEFQGILVEVNACRDKNLSARTWQELERHLILWEAVQDEHQADWESWMTVVWLAVQESWRHMLLTYLYMSVCGMSSDDPRIQSSVRQSLQIFRTIKGRESPNGGMFLFLQYLMAGICARTERQRSEIRRYLVTRLHSRFWQLRVTDFIAVLDDLWHSAAADGSPITWDDYILSRERILPVVP